MVTYHQLRTFVTIARSSSLTTAGRELGLSQPTVSLHLGALTRFLDARLLERHDGRLRLTAAGEKFRAYAEAALAGLRALRQDIESANGHLAGPLGVGATYIMSRYVLPSAISRFLEHYPGIDVQLRVEFAEPLFDEILANALDVMCYIDVPAPLELATEVLGREELIVFASPRNSLAGRRRVTAHALSGQPFVAPTSPSLNGLIEGKLRARGVIPRVAARGRHHETLKDLVESHDGYSMLIRSSVADELASGRFVALRLDGPLQTVPLMAAYRTRPRVSPLVRAFVDFVRDDLARARAPEIPRARTGRPSRHAAGRRARQPAGRKRRR